MLTVHVPISESYDEVNLEFVQETVKLEFEHSLVTLSKWETEHEKPFLGPGSKTGEEAFSYYRAMLVTPDVPDELLYRLSEDNVKAINGYINGKQTATWFKESGPTSAASEVITAELIYYWMLSLNISMECQHWHLNKLITLIRVTNEKNKPPKKRSAAEMAEERSRLNAQRKAALGTTG